MISCPHCKVCMRVTKDLPDTWECLTCEHTEEHVSEPGMREDALFIAVVVLGLATASTLVSGLSELLLLY